MVLSCQPAAPTPAPLPPPAGAKNILYILVDDLRTQMSPYGHTFMQTPRLQQLAGESLVFDQAHVQSQMCVPTRNSFMTGRRPEMTTVFNDGIGVAPNSPGTPTLTGFRAAPGGSTWTTLPGYFNDTGTSLRAWARAFTRISRRISTSPCHGQAAVLLPSPYHARTRRTCGAQCR